MLHVWRTTRYSVNQFTTQTGPSSVSPPTFKSLCTPLPFTNCYNKRTDLEVSERIPYKSIYHSDDGRSKLKIKKTFKRSSMLRSSERIEASSRSGHAMTSHHHGWVRFQVSDRKLIEYTTEMILWSIILMILWLLILYKIGQNIFTSDWLLLSPKRKRKHLICNNAFCHIKKLCIT